MPSRDSKRNQYGNYGCVIVKRNNCLWQKKFFFYLRNANGRGGGAPRNHVIPNEPPFTAYIGNAPDSMVQGDFETYLFVGLKVKQVRLVRDRQTDRFRGKFSIDYLWIIYYLYLIKRFCLCGFRRCRFITSSNWIRWNSMQMNREINILRSLILFIAC